MFRSTESLTAAAIKVREVALMEKNLQGNQNCVWRKPLIRSAAIATRHARDAAAMYMPIQGIGALNFWSFRWPSRVQPSPPIFLFSSVLFDLLFGVGAFVSACVVYDPFLNEI